MNYNINRRFDLLIAGLAKIWTKAVAKGLGYSCLAQMAVLQARSRRMHRSSKID